VPLGATAALRAVGYVTKFAGLCRCGRSGAGEDVNDGQRMGVRLSLLWQPTDAVRLTPRVVYQEIEATASTARKSSTSTPTLHRAPRAASRSASSTLLRERFRDKTRLADLTASADLGGIELTSITSYIDRDILVSRDASALTGSVSVDLGFPAAVNLPSNLVDTTDLKQWSQEVRLSSTDSGPFSWVVGGFYSSVDRQYSQRLPTPGFDAARCALGAGHGSSSLTASVPTRPTTPTCPMTSAEGCVWRSDVRLGPVKLTGGAATTTSMKAVTSARRPASPARPPNGDKTTSNGFSPRAILSFEPNRNLTFNLQAAKGLPPRRRQRSTELPLCTPAGPGAVRRLPGL
jgi:iron complex outermembrane receptor protein